MKRNLNVPNMLTLLRVILVPVFMLSVLVPEDNAMWRCIATGIFLLISFTDMLDGKIARKYGLVTNFGKFLDPLADKLLILGALLALLCRYQDTLGNLLVWATFTVVFRELAVTSLRLIAVNKNGRVIAASFLGKIKTVSQMFSICIVLLEPVIITPTLHTPQNLFSVIALVCMALATLLSGADYFIKYLKDEPAIRH